MIFPAMMFLLGFVCASLLAWLIMPPIIRKIARKNKDRRKKMPDGMKQALADKDLLRAEFALSLCKREHDIEKLENRAHNQLIEIAERNAQIGSLKKEMDKITDLADRRYRDKEKLRHNLKTKKNTKSKPQKPGKPKKDNVHKLVPKDIKLSDVSKTVQASKKDAVGKGSLANRIRKLKNTD